jgi:hypothetical protein
VLGRSRFRDRGRGSGVGGANLLNQATIYLGGVAPYHYLDFIANRALYASVDVGNVTQATGYSFTRASTGYYQNADGTLTLFGSGALRRGDRGVLIEGSRTNLLTYSQEFDNAAWTKANTTVTVNATAAPDGTATADLITLTGASIGIRNSASASAGAKTYSFFVKSSGGSRYFQILTDGTVQAFANFDIQTQTTGTLGTSVNSASVTTLGNGWYRLVMTATDASATNPYIALVSGLTAAWSSGASSGAFFVWGAQLEAASFASSYIPTVAASATRASDVLSYTAGVSYPIQLFAEFERVVDTGGPEGIVQVDASSRAQRANMNISGVNADRLTAGTTGGISAAGSTMGVNVTVGANTKAAGRYQSGNVLVAQNGSLGTASTDPNNIPSTPDTLRIGDAGSAANPLFGYIRRIAVIQGAGTDANLIAMTS